MPPIRTEENYIQKTIIADLALGLQRLNSENIKQLIKASSSSLNTTATTKTYRSFQQRLKLLDLVIAKADKGETMVILNWLDYVNQIHQFLEQSIATPMRYKFIEHNEAI